jgi:hypothetical protein
MTQMTDDLTIQTGSIKLDAHVFKKHKNGIYQEISPLSISEILCIFELESKCFDGTINQVGLI